MAGRHIRVLPWCAGRLWRRDRGGQRPRPHLREEDRLGDVEALEEVLQQVSQSVALISLTPIRLVTITMEASNRMFCKVIGSVRIATVES